MHFTGTNVFFIFTRNKPQNPFPRTRYSGLVELLGCALPFFMVDLVGRRILFMISGAGMMVSLVIAGIAEYLPQNLGVLCLVAVVFYMSNVFGRNPLS